MQAHEIASRHWPAVWRPASIPSGIRVTITGVPRRGWLVVVTLAFALVASWSAHAGSSYLAVWSSDKDPAKGNLNTDFLAIIDADPRSPTYGKVVSTASLQHVPGVNLLNDLGYTDALGLATQYGFPPTGIPSDVLNEAHHMSHEPIVDGRHRYLYLGGLISANVFRCDVADPLTSPPVRWSRRRKTSKTSPAWTTSSRRPTATYSSVIWVRTT